MKMEDLKPKARQIFELVLHDLPEPLETDPHLVNTAKILANLAHRWPEPLSQKQKQHHLEQLCRKIHVANKLMATYAPGWKKLPEALPLSQLHWPVLITVLLGYSQLADIERALALKYLNAALQALRLAGSQETVPHFSKLRAWAEEALETFNLERK